MRSYETNFPLFKTKVEGVTKIFNLSNPAERREYFEAKAGAEIAVIKKYLEKNSFISYFLGKKNSGKGTYSKMLKEIFGDDAIGHISVGDVVRAAHLAMDDQVKKQEIVDYLEKHYRGYISIDDAINALLGRDQKTLLPTEFILTLVKMEIAKMHKKSIFIDGFPRELDQVSYSLYLRDLVDYRDDQDIFVAISIPESILAARMQARVVCPLCHVPRSLKLMRTQQVGWDSEKKEFYLVCDDQKCNGARMVAKEGDEMGIESIRERLELDEKLIEQAFLLHGIPKILVRNAIPVEFARENMDAYELTPEYVYALKENGDVEVLEKPWIIKDDDGNDVHSLLAAPVVLSLIKQLANVLQK
ncbi:MAG: nucleoside monophosphate kinase [Patescibacteria group bacterium]